VPIHFCCECVCVRQVYRAEREMMRLTGRYTERLEELLNPAFCNSKTKHNTVHWKWIVFTTMSC
jgi:hypothetical protein